MKHVAFLTAFLITSTLFAQEGPKPAEPAKEHQWLGKLVGKWDCEFECVVPNMPPIKFKGTENVRAVGKLWVVSEGEAGDDTMKVQSRLTLGFDPAKKKFVGTWIDSMQTTMWTYEGALDEAGKKLTLEAEGPNPMTGKTCKFRESIEWKSDDERVFTSNMLGDDGKWTEFMKITQKRVK